MLCAAAHARLGAVRVSRPGVSLAGVGTVVPSAVGAGVAPVLAFQGEAALARRLSLEGAHGAAQHVVVIEGRLVALNAAPVVGTAAEDAGVPRLPRAVSTLVAALVTICAPDRRSYWAHQLVRRKVLDGNRLSKGGSLLLTGCGIA